MKKYGIIYTIYSAREDDTTVIFFYGHSFYYGTNVKYMYMDWEICYDQAIPYIPSDKIDKSDLSINNLFYYGIKVNYLRICWRFQCTVFNAFSFHCFYVKIPNVLLSIFTSVNSIMVLIIFSRLLDLLNS